jgi:hypothetical protein
MILTPRSALLAVLVLMFLAFATPMALETSADNQPGKLQQKSQTEYTQVIQGEASGTLVAGGKTVSLKYAYATPVRRVQWSKGEEVQVYYVAITDRPIPAESLIDIKTFRINVGDMLILNQIHGLEYEIHRYGYWAMFHPGGWTITMADPLKEFSIENNIIKGRDEGESNSSSGRVYRRSVRFVAPLPKGKP